MNGVKQEDALFVIMFAYRQISGRVETKFDKVWKVGTVTE